MKLLKADVTDLFSQYSTELGVAKYSYNNNKHNFEHFACTCSDKHAELWKQILENYKKELMESLSADGVDTENVDIITYITKELGFEYGIECTGIGTDMWFGISFTKQFKNDEPLEMFIQCDELVYGFLCALLIARKALQ